MKAIRYARLRRRRPPAPAEQANPPASEPSTPAERAMRALSVLPASVVPTKVVLDQYLEAIGAGS